MEYLASGIEFDQAVGIVIAGHINRPQPQIPLMAYKEA